MTNLVNLIRVLVALGLAGIGVLYLGNGSGETLGLAAVGVVLLIMAAVAFPWKAVRR